MMSEVIKKIIKYGKENRFPSEVIARTINLCMFLEKQDSVDKVNVAGYKSSSEINDPCHLEIRFCTEKDSVSGQVHKEGFHYNKVRRGLPTFKLFMTMKDIVEDIRKS